MNAGAVVFFVLAGVAAVTNWVAVARHDVTLERIAKPATLLLLIVVALVLHPADAGERDWFIVALLLSLTGDVLLMPPGEHFVPGLVAFLLAHLAYIAAFFTAGVTFAHVALGAGVVVLVSALIGGAIVSAVRRGSDAALAAPVTAYLVVISAMVAAAIGTAEGAAALGALLFYCSDGLIAWNKFRRPLRWAPVAIMVTYHLAQATLVASLR